MNSGSHLARFVFVSATALLLTGCLFQSSIAPVRYFVLAPMPANEPVSTAEQISVGIAPVKMPSYLLRTSVAVRHGTNEIEYLEDARWGERLDQCFQRTLAANLSRLLPSDHVYAADWAGSQVMARVFVDVQEFDVDTAGRGTLIARWRIQPPDNGAAPKSGTARLERPGSPPRGDALVIAATLSDLTAEFSRGLAQSIRESVKAKD
jgi:uncharacterized lipoprotein YmbA